MKNNIVYGMSRESIPRALLEAPVDKFIKGFIMWGAISSRGLISKDDPIFIDEFLDGYQWKPKASRTMNSRRYIDLSREQIIPSIEKVYSDSDYIFQDDCDSIHLAKCVIDFIDENTPDRIMPAHQASKLDDVWPIENVWSIVRTKLMKNRLSEFISSQGRNCEHMEEFRSELVFSNDVQYSELRAVIKQRGRRILKSDF